MLGRSRRSLRRAVPALLLMTLLGTGVRPTAAAAATVGAALGSIELSGAEGFYLPSLGRTSPIGVLETFDFYLLMEVDYGDLGRAELNSTHGIREWEAYVGIPSQITVLEAVPFPESAPVPGDERNWILDLGRPVLASSTPLVAVRFHAIMLEEQHDLHIGLEPSRPSRVEDLDPAWMESDDSGECTGDLGTPVPCVRVFQRVCGISVNCMDLCRQSYCGVVANEVHSWSAWKSRYQD